MCHMNLWLRGSTVDPATHEQVNLPALVHGPTSVPGVRSRTGELNWTPMNARRSPPNVRRSSADSPVFSTDESLPAKEPNLSFRRWMCHCSIAVHGEKLIKIQSHIQIKDRFCNNYIQLWGRVQTSELVGTFGRIQRPQLETCWLGIGVRTV